MTEPIRDLKTAVAVRGALPMPAGSEPQPLTVEQRKTIANLIGDAKAAMPSLLVSLAESVRGRIEHEHPTWEDLYCLNLTSYMGERMGPVLRRLLDAEARAERYRTAWGLARTRAISTGGAADRYAAQARDAQEALQHMLFTVIAGQMALKANTDEAADLRARVGELETANAGLDDLRQRALARQDQLRARIAELEAELHTAQAHGRTFLEQRNAHARELLGLRSRVGELENERHSTNEALSDVTVELREREAAPLTVYQASHDSIAMGLYTSREAAREHCQKLMKRENPTATLEWRPDGEWREGDNGEPAADEAEELYAYGTHETSSWDPTGYAVAPLEVASAYDEEADE